MPDLNNCTIAVIGLGYVGLPLAVEYGRTYTEPGSKIKNHRSVIGYDINKRRIDELARGYDRTMEVSEQTLMASTQLRFSYDKECLSEADVYIVTVPTPIDECKKPDMGPLRSATETVAEAMYKRREKGVLTQSIIIYESTVYPGATEEYCIPIIQKKCGLVLNTDYFCGYSPERINPADKKHRLTDIVKITSGSSKECADWIDCLYSSIIKAGTYRASSIKVAEAAKVIENTQRDLNIALINELSLIFHKIGLDTLEVLEAARTKWNFLDFRPGLVGGHCIGVDPYYLTYKAEKVGYYPQVVLAGRRINDGMGRWIGEQLILEMARRCLLAGGCEVLILGITFKENCSDIRNTKVMDIIATLKEYSVHVSIFDPVADPEEAMNVYGIELKRSIPERRFRGVVCAVGHKEFMMISATEWIEMIEPGGILFDVKGCIPIEAGALRL